MIPTAASENFDFKTVEQPTKTYRLDMEKGTVSGYCDGLEAMRQAVYKILHTERYSNAIYSWNYGIELNGFFGRPIPFVYSELKRRITDALLQDSRITEVNGFSFSSTKGEVMASFTVTTTEGDMSAERTVSI